MKKQLMNLVIAAAVFLAWGCSTSNDVKPANTTYKFTVNGTTYTQVTAADSTASLTGGAKTLNTLGVTGQSADKTASAGLLFFWSGTAKPKAGLYTVTGDATKMTASQVAVLVIDKVNVAKQGLYGTTGLDGASITVAVSSSGKISVTMPTIAIKGTNFDNTDSKNTVTSDVTGSISGAAAEQ
jgi:hypothetical protein